MAAGTVRGTRDARVPMAPRRGNGIGAAAEGSGSAGRKAVVRRGSDKGRGGVGGARSERREDGAKRREDGTKRGAVQGAPVLTAAASLGVLARGWQPRWGRRRVAHLGSRARRERCRPDPERVSQHPPQAASLLANTPGPPTHHPNATPSRRSPLALGRRAGTAACTTAKLARAAPEHQPSTTAPRLPGLQEQVERRCGDFVVTAFGRGRESGRGRWVGATVQRARD